MKDFLLSVKLYSIRNIDFALQILKIYKHTHILNEGGGGRDERVRRYI